MDPTPYDVFAVELSSFQLHYTDSMTRRERGGAQRRRGPPRLVRRRRRPAWPTTPPTRAAIYRGVQQACVYNVADPETERLVREADVAEGARADRLHPRHAGGRHGRRRRRPPGRPGVHRRAAVERGRAVHGRRPAPARRRTSSPTPWPPRRWPGPTASPRPRCATGCAASAPTATGSPPSADGRRRSPGSTTPRPPTPTPPCRRCWPTTRWCGSRAVWPRAPASTTWSPATRDRLRGVVLLGRDRDVIARALARHAPDVPVIAVDGGRDWQPDMPPWSVRSWPRADLAQPGDTVLLAPGCASMDMFTQLRRPGRRLRRGGAAPDRRLTAARRKGARGPMAIVSPLRARTTPDVRPDEPRAAPRQVRGLVLVRRAARRARAPAHVVLPAARRLGPAADHRPDHGVQRLERLRVPELRPATPTPSSSSS